MEQANPFDQFDSENPFDQFDAAQPDVAEATPQPDQKPTPPDPQGLNDAQRGIQDYAKQLVDQQGSYDTADLEVAGYSAADIKGYEDFVKKDQAASAVPMATDGPVLEPGGYPTDMYKNLSMKEAYDYYYNVVLKDENVSPPIGGLGYAVYTNPTTGKTDYVLPPVPKLFSDGAKSSEFDLAAVGLAAAFGNAIELGGAALEKAGVEGATNYTDKLVPGVNTGQSAMDALLVEGVPMIVAGGGVGGAVYKGLKALPSILRAAGATLAGEVANSTVSADKAGTILVGENSILPVLRGVDLEDGAANDVIEARMNIMLDGMLASGIVANGIQGAVTLGKFGYNLTARPLLDVLSSDDSGIEKQVIDDIFAQLMRVDSKGYSDPQVAFEVRDKIAQIVQDNKTVILPMINNVDEDFKMTLDSMSALERGIEGGSDNSMLSIIQGIRNEAIQKNRPLTGAAVREPMSQLDTQTNELLQTTGGQTATEQTATMGASADVLAGQGRQEVTAASDAAKSASDAYYKTASTLVADVANDVELGDEIRRLASAVGTEIDTSVTASRQQIVGQIEQGYTSLTRQKNDLYGAISGGEVDVDGLIKLLDDLPVEQITQASQNVRNSSPVRGLLQTTKRQLVDDVDALGKPTTRYETDEERAGRVGKFLASKNMDFGFFYKNIRPEVSQLAEDMYQTSPVAGRNLRDVVKFIDEDMVNFVAENGDEQTAQAARDALGFYKETYAPLFRDGRLSDYSKLYDTTVGRTGSISQEAQDIVSVQRFKETDYSTGTRDLVNETMRSGDPASVAQFKRLLSMNEAGADPNPLASYMVADSVSKAHDVLRSSGGTDAQLGGFVNTLRQYSEALNANFPEKAAELNGFIRSIEAATGNREQLKAVMEQANATMTATLQDVQQSELRFFFRREFGAVDDPILKDLATTSNPQASFRSLILSEQPDRIAALEAIMGRVKAIPDPDQQKVVQDGLETAYLRIFRDQNLSPRRETGDLRAIMPARIERSQEELTSLYRVGDIIYADKPEVMDAVKGVAEVASGIARSRNATPVASMSATAFNQAAMTATNRLIYMTIGPLSRPGTRIRSLIASLVQGADATARADAVRDKVLANPDLFVELSRKYNSQPNDENLQNMLIRFFYEGGLRGATASTNTAPEDNYPIPNGMGAEAGMQ